MMTPEELARYLFKKFGTAAKFDVITETRKSFYRDIANEIFEIAIKERQKEPPTITWRKWPEERPEHDGWCVTITHEFGVRKNCWNLLGENEGWFILECPITHWCYESDILATLPNEDQPADSQPEPTAEILRRAVNHINALELHVADYQQRMEQLEDYNKKLQTQLADTATYHYDVRKKLEQRIEELEARVKELGTQQRIMKSLMPEYQVKELEGAK